MTNFNKACLLCLISIIIGASSCEKKEESIIQNIDCILFTDINGQPLGTYNNCDLKNQWAFQELSNEERNFFPQDFGSASFVEPIPFQGVSLFPNPIPMDQPFSVAFFTDSTESYIFQIALVDREENILFQTQGESTGSTTIQIDSGSLNSGNFYRVYYQFITEENKIAFEGFGNILICREAPITNIEADCF